MSTALTQLTTPALPASPDACPVTVYLANALTTDASRAGMMANLRRAARVLTGGLVEDPRLLPWQAIGQAHVARLRTLLLEEGAAPATVNTILAGVRGVLREGWRLGLITTDAYQRAIDVAPARGARVDRTGRCLQAGEVSALMTACEGDTTAAGARDAALIGLALAGGLRRAELAGLTMADYSPADSEGLARLVVAGKGRKERVVYLNNGSAAAVADWLQVRGTTAGPLFLAVNKAGRVVASDQPLSGQAIGTIIGRRQAAAGVAPFTPHDCRRTAISAMLDAGVDITTVAGRVGHASVDTTAGYDRRGDRAQRAAAGQTVHIPYHGRQG